MIKQRLALSFLLVKAKEKVLELNSSKLSNKKKHNICKEKHFSPGTKFQEKFIEVKTIKNWVLYVRSFCLFFPLI